MPRAESRAAVRCLALVVPGLEELAVRELREAGATVLETLSRFDKRDSLIILEARDPSRLLRCKLLEDVALVLSDASTPAPRDAPRALARQLEGSSFESAMRLHHALRPAKRGRSYGVMVRVAGRHPFRREDVQVALFRALKRMLPHWRPAGTAPAVEVWAHVVGRRTILALRVSGDELAQRRYKHRHIEGSLKPTVAHALVQLAGVAPREVVLDPMCGAGTIVRECADAVPGARVVGGDIDGSALAAAAENVRHGDRMLRLDARRLPIRPAPVDVIITNPPFGRRHEAGDASALYRALLRDFARVLRPGGRCVVLAGDASLMLSALPRTLVVRNRVSLLLRGLPVTAFVIVRR